MMPTLGFLKAVEVRRFYCRSLRTANVAGLAMSKSYDTKMAYASWQDGGTHGGRAAFCPSGIRHRGIRRCGTAYLLAVGSGKRRGTLGRSPVVRVRARKRPRCKAPQGELRPRCRHA